MSSITPQLRLYIETRYALGRTYAALAADLNDEVLAKRYFISKATVYRLARRGFTVLKCNNSKKEISADFLGALEIDVNQRKKFEALAKVDNARSIGLDVGLKTERVRAIGTYGMTKKTAPTVAQQIDYVRRFLTAPVVSYGICQGYY
jgi:hypothetical protein